MANQTVIVSVLADTKKFKKEFQDLGNNNDLNKLGDQARKFGKAMGVAALAGGAALVAFGKKSVSAASDLEQSIGGVDSVFKNNANTIHQWAKDADTRLGLSQNSYNELATVIGTTLKNSGIPMQELTGQTDDLIERSADLAATFGGPVTESSTAVAAALRGEFEPLRRYGISLSVAEVNARALADTGKTNVDQLTKQEKALATQAIIMGQSSDAAGAFARESNTLAGQQERLKAQFENLAATVGVYLLPAITSLVAWIAGNLVPALQTTAVWVAQNLGPALADLGTVLSVTVVPALALAGQWIQDNRAWLEPLVLMLTAAAAGYGAYALATTGWTAATNLAKAAQIALNLALAANPIGLVIAAVAALAAGIIYLWNTNEGFRTAITTAWAAIKASIGAVWDWLTNTAVPGITAGIAAAVDTITGLPARAKAALAGILTTLRSRGAELVRGLIDGITSKVSAFITTLRQLPGRAREALAGALSTLRSRGVEFLTGLIRGLTDRYATFTATLGQLPGRASSALSAAGSALRSRGVEFLTGLIRGITSKFTSLTTYVRMIPSQIKSALSGAGTLLWGVGQDLVKGLINGLWSMASWLGSQISSLVSRYVPGPIKKILGIASPSKLFADIGRDTMRGLQAGLADQAKAVLAEVSRFGTTLARTDLSLTGDLTPALAPAGSLAGARAVRGGNTYHVHLEMLAPTPDVGRQVVSAIKDYERLAGVGR